VWEEGSCEASPYPDCVFPGVIRQHPFLAKIERQVFRPAKRDVLNHDNPPLAE
jgi:hypothetical protein